MIEVKEYARAAKYAEELADVKEGAYAWEDVKNRLDCAGLQDDAAYLVLIHPWWYADEKCGDPRGSRRMDIGSANRQCQSESVWGYACPFSNVEITTDHLFPWSLGGATDVRNMISLCETHNQAKGWDWHVHELRPSGLPWFNDMLRKVENCVTRGTDGCSE